MWRVGAALPQTSIMAVAFDGGVVLGADSRTTTGTYIANRVSDKITPMTESIFCCRSGSAADTQAISDYVRYVLDRRWTRLCAAVKPQSISCLACKNSSFDGGWGCLSCGGRGSLSLPFLRLTPLFLASLLHAYVFFLCRYYLDMHVIEMGTPPLVKTAARLFRELCYSNKSQLMAGIICAGWDSAKGGQVRARGWSMVGVLFGRRLRAGGVSVSSVF